MSAQRDPLLVARLEVAVFEAANFFHNSSLNMMSHPQACPLVVRRIMCDKCGYGMMECRYLSIEEWAEAIDKQ